MTAADRNEVRLFVSCMASLVLFVVATLRFQEWLPFFAGVIGGLLVGWLYVCMRFKTWLNYEARIRDLDAPRPNRFRNAMWNTFRFNRTVIDPILGILFVMMVPSPAVATFGCFAIGAYVGFGLRLLQLNWRHVSGKT